MFWRLFRHTVIRRRGLLCGAVLSLFSAGCYDDAGTPATTIETPPATTTLAELHRLYAGRTVRIESDIFVRGRVVTSDRAGNFYRTLVLEEQGAAAELMAGIDGLHNVYPEGCELTVGLRGSRSEKATACCKSAASPKRAAAMPPTTSARAPRSMPTSSAATRTPRCGRPSARSANSRPTWPDGWSASTASATPRNGRGGDVGRIQTLHRRRWQHHPHLHACVCRFRGPGDSRMRGAPRRHPPVHLGADDAPRYLLKLRDETDCWY